ncbi:type II toxin-antitoxin system Phd/YefM family antitoxin [Marinibaculum pumilum]|uniref:Antitoxin n=1 Tax=Marinibaculum pumilum TaxID=1766165 RepID=A0ABV7L498_9PROT
MEIPVTDAKGRLTDLIRRAEAGEEILLTRHGRPVARLVGLQALPRPADRRALLQSLQAAAARKITAGPDAARSQDFLYGDEGLPG